MGIKGIKYFIQIFRMSSEAPTLKDLVIVRHSETAVRGLYCPEFPRITDADYNSRLTASIIGDRNVSSVVYSSPTFDRAKFTDAERLKRLYDWEKETENFGYFDIYFRDLVNEVEGKEERPIEVTARDGLATIEVSNVFSMNDADRHNLFLIYAVSLADAGVFPDHPEPLLLEESNGSVTYRIPGKKGYFKITAWYEEGTPMADVRAFGTRLRFISGNFIGETDHRWLSYGERQSREKELKEYAMPHAEKLPPLIRESLGV